MYGGIFNTDSVLGMPTSLGGGDVCQFYAGNVNAVATQVQQALVAMGVQGLAIDGRWGPCSENAFYLVFGEGTSAGALKKYLGIECDGFTKSVQGTCPQEPIYIPKSTGVQRPTFQVAKTASTMTAMPVSRPQINAPGTPTTQTTLPPLHTTQPIMLPTPGGGLPYTPPTPYTPPVPDGAPPSDAFMTPPGAPAPTPWIRYAIIAGLLGAAALGGYWLWRVRQEDAEPEPKLPTGRLAPVGTIE